MPEMPGSHLVAVATIVAILAGSGCANEAPLTTDVATETRCFAIEEFAEGLPHTRGWRTNPSLADVDGDGDLDLAATTRKGEDPTVFLFGTGGWVSQPLSIDGFPCGVGVELTDLTADGLVDLLVADHCRGLYLFKGGGDGTFARLSSLGHPTGEGFNDAAVGDLDGDGLLDIVAIAALSKGYSIFMGEGAPGTFKLHKSNLPNKGWGFDLHLYDLNGDGLLDILGTLEGFNPEEREGGHRPGKVWLQKPGGTWAQAPGFPEEGNFWGIARGDFDEDGLPDLAISSRDPEGGILLFRGEAPGAWAATAPVGRQHRRLITGIAVADMDGDGHQDLAAVEHRTPAVVIWLGDGRGEFTECPDRAGVAREDRPGWGIAVGDVNRDGSMEVVVGFGTESGGALKAWSFKPTGKRPAPATAQVPDPNH